MKDLLIVATGSGAGGVLRYLAQTSMQRLYPTVFPLGTFLVNVSGCLLIGVFFALLEKQAVLNHSLSLLLITGFCGGFTTFSSFSIENMQLLKAGHIVAFLLYVTGSIVLGLAATLFGIFIVKG